MKIATIRKALMAAGTAAASAAAAALVTAYPDGLTDTEVGVIGGAAVTAALAAGLAVFRIPNAPKDDAK
ncbi:MAG TPA: hypothetical protein VLJ88_01665 [Propionibacteriaceae bacterium]|nr:hypothetical protein [Propionibacteriaceae bacterium]